MSDKFKYMVFGSIITAIGFLIGSINTDIDAQQGVTSLGTVVINDLHHTDVKGAMMGAGEEFLLDYEARWLDRHHFFNDTHIRTDIPRFVESKPLRAIGDDIVRFNIVAASKSVLPPEI